MILMWKHTSDFKQMGRYDSPNHNIYIAVDPTSTLILVHVVLSTFWQYRDRRKHKFSTLIVCLQ